MKPERSAERFDKRGLRESRHADEKGMATRENVNKDKLNDGILSEDDAGNQVLDTRHFRPDVIDTSHNVRLGGVVHFLSNLLRTGPISDFEYMLMLPGDTTSLRQGSCLIRFTSRGKKAEVSTALFVSIVERCACRSLLS